MSKFAIVGDDGTRPVVWGIGDTVEAAQQDAAEWTENAGLLTVHEITDVQAEIVLNGDVTWPIASK